MIRCNERSQLNDVDALCRCSHRTLIHSLCSFYGIELVENALNAHAARGLATIIINK